MPEGQGEACTADLLWEKGPGHGGWVGSRCPWWLVTAAVVGPLPPSRSGLRGSASVATGLSLDTNVYFYPHNPGFLTALYFHWQSGQQRNKTKGSVSS